MELQSFFRQTQCTVVVVKIELNTEKFEASYGKQNLWCASVTMVWTTVPKIDKSSKFKQPVIGAFTLTHLSVLLSANVMQQSCRMIFWNMIVAHLGMEIFTLCMISIYVSDEVR